MPTPIIDTNKRLGSEMKFIDNNPIPPMAKANKCVMRLLNFLATKGSKNATKAATPLYTAKQMPTQSAPSL